MKKNIFFKITIAALLFCFNFQTFSSGLAGQRLFVEEAAAYDYYYIDIDYYLENLVYYDFIQVLDVPTESVTTVTQVVANPLTAVDIYCPWECGEEYWYPDGFKAIPAMCTEADEMVDSIRADISSGATGDWDGAGLWGADSVYNAGEQVAWDGLWVWDKHGVTTGIGWTAWWVALANYCEGQSYWSSSNKSEIQYGDTTTLTFTIAEHASSNGTYDALTQAKTTETVRMEGTYAGGATVAAKTVTTPNFNSPFIYLDVPDGEYTVSLDSEWDMYQAVLPAFTSVALWDLSVTNGQIAVAGVAQEHLFYELAMHRIDLTRNGLNFTSKQELKNYLEESDFFGQLAMSEREKENSLTYLFPRLPESENYFLTVLTDESVNALSTLTVTPTPEKLVRTYYAVYPTKAPVATTGGLNFTQKDTGGNSVVKEYGEIIIKPEMYVFWK